MYTYAPGYKIHAAVCMIFADFNLLIVETTTTLLIGISTARFCKRVSELASDSDPLLILEQNVEVLIKAFTQLKQGAESVLFVTFGIETVYFIFLCYMVRMNQEMAPYVLFVVLKLTYVAFALENCYKNYKSLIRMLR